MEKVKTNIFIKILVEVSRILLGVTFVFSGFVKATDPFGTAYKIEDYFSAFNLSSLSFLAMPISYVQSIFEFVLGVFLLLGIYRKWNSRMLFLVMCFMTPLTLYLAISNPVEDCGCFGDALVISNWETFFKNIVLLICSIIILIYHEKISNFFTGKTYWIALLYIVIFISGFVVYNHYYDPIVDFRPYRVGANIPELMIVEEGKGHIEENRMIYSKDGVEKEFTQDNYPWEDSTWTFVRMNTTVIQEGELPKIKDFTISKLIFDQDMNDVLGEDDITTEVLSDTGYVFLMISPSLAEMNESCISNFEDVMNYANDYHYKFYCLTASVTSDIIDWEKENAVDLNFCRTDERTLKTIIRTNPGLLLIKNGIIINKWADITAPGEENLNMPLEKLPYSIMVDQKKEDKGHLIYISAIFILPLLFLKLLDILLFRKNEEELIAGKKKKEAN